MAYIIPDNYESLVISAEEIPVKLSAEFNGISLFLTFRYNDEGDFYTLEIADENDAVLLAQKVTYGKDLFERLSSQFELKTKIIPLDVGREKQDNPSGDLRVGASNFGKSVELVVLRG